MENRVYYGEYSLSHWIKLILKENISLPTYQRSFVWNENKVKTLIKTLENKLFIPPVTIGAFNIEKNRSNFILDGQQRLTSLLLSYLDIFPNKEKFIEKNATIYLNDNDDDEDDDQNNRIEWTFEKLLELGNTKEKILNKIKNSEEYVKLNIETSIKEDFFDNHFLGFTYIVPQTNDKQGQQRFYSSVFRNINIQGESLSIQESRKSLYFLNDYFISFFETNPAEDLKVKQSGQIKNVDFIKYLSFLFQYKKDNNTKKLAQGFSGKKGTNKTIETYYEEFIYSIVGERESNLFEDFRVVFPDNFLERFRNLEKCISILIDNKEFPSVINLDMYLFGLVYKIVFQNKGIDIDKKTTLINELNSRIDNFKGVTNHLKSPASLKYLRERINDSIEVYNKYEAQQPQ